MQGINRTKSRNSRFYSFVHSCSCPKYLFYIYNNNDIYLHNKFILKLKIITAAIIKVLTGIGPPENFPKLHRINPILIRPFTCWYVEEGFLDNYN